MKNAIALVFCFLILIPLLAQEKDLYLSDPSFKTNLKQWELVKTMPVIQSNVKSVHYFVERKVKPYQLQLQDDKGHVFWTKTNLRLGADLYDVENIVPFRYDNKPFIGANGTVACMDSSYNRYILVDNKGNESSLPPHSAALACVAQFYNKYWVLNEEHYSDEEIYGKNYEDAGDYAGTFPWNNKISFMGKVNGIVIADEKGNILKQFVIPKLGRITSYWYLDEKLRFFIYKWYNHKTQDEGYIRTSTDGTILSRGEEGALDVINPVFSEDGELWMPVNDELLRICDYKTGKLIFELWGLAPSGYISNRKAGIIIVHMSQSVYVVDYLHKVVIGNFQFSKVGYIGKDTWISPDGKEISFTLSPKDKPAEIRYYRMK